MSQKLHTSAPYLSFVSLRKYLVRKNLLFVPQPDSLSWEWTLSLRSVRILLFVPKNQIVVMGVDSLISVCPDPSFCSTTRYSVIVVHYLTSVRPDPSFCSTTRYSLSWEWTLSLRSVRIILFVPKNQIVVMHSLTLVRPDPSFWSTNQIVCHGSGLSHFGPSGSLFLLWNKKKDPDGPKWESALQ